MTLDGLRRFVAPLRTRIANMVARAVVGTVDDAPTMQVLQIDLLPGETRDEIERFQNYGFTGVPFAGAEAVVLFVDGRRAHGLAVAVDDRRYRVSGLAPGEVAMYTDEGDRIVIYRGGTVTVTAATAIELGGNTEAAIKGSTYRTAETTLVTALNVGFVAVGVGFAALATYLTAAGTAWTNLAQPAAATAAGVGATAAGVAATACTTAATACTTFEAGAAGFLSAKVKL